VTDFAAARSQAETGLANREGGEVVVEDKVFPLIPLDIVKDLFVEHGTQGSNRQGLGFSPGKEGRTVGPGEDPHFAGDIPNIFGTPAVNADTLI